MSHIYHEDTKKLIWEYSESNGWWGFLLVTLFFFIGLNIEIALHIFGQVSIKSDGIDTNYWFNLGGMLMSLWLLIMLIRPPILGCFIVNGSSFKFDSGRCRMDILGYVAYYYEDFPDLIKVSKKLMGLGYTPSLVPTRIQLSGEVTEISNLILKQENQGLQLTFQFRNKNYRLTNKMTVNDLMKLHEIMLKECK